MFCPKCATQNADGVSFCRSCGANLSLIPQALAGVPVESETDESCATKRAFRRGREVGIDSAVRNMFMGFAFLLVAIALSRTIGAMWWFWMLIPAFSIMGTGVAQFIRAREKEKKNQVFKPLAQQSFGATSTPRNLAARRTDELMAPVPSVTEGTTRHLGVEAPTRHFESKQ